MSFASCLLAQAPVSPGTLDYSRLCLHPCGASQTPQGLEGTVLGGMVGDSGRRPPAEEPVLFVGLNHFPFSCFSTKVLQSRGFPPWHPKQRKPMERLALTWLLPAAAAVDPHSPLHPPGSSQYRGCPGPRAGVPALHSSEMPHFLLFSSSFWHDSHAGLGPGSPEEPQHMDTSQGREVRAEGHRSPTMELSGEERKSKEHLCCNSGERGGDFQMWIISSCWE